MPAPYVLFTVVFNCRYYEAKQPKDIDHVIV